MKKSLLTIIFGLACCFSVLASEPLTFYGVDFSLAKVYGADESRDAFGKAFSDINQLFISQESKYDVACLTGEEVTSKRISVACKSTKHHFMVADSIAVFFLEDPEYDCRAEIDALLKSYELPTAGRSGMVMIANLLNKAHGEADFYVVIFDTQSREMTSCYHVWGHAGGFGLRNYWANAVRLALKQYPKVKKMTLKHQKK